MRFDKPHDCGEVGEVFSADSCGGLESFDTGLECGE